MPNQNTPLRVSRRAFGAAALAGAGTAVALPTAAHAAPGGKNGGRNSAAISAIMTVETGVVSEGFMTMVLPAAMAGANFQIAIIIG